MKCRAGCGACCIAPSVSGGVPGISGGIPGMKTGKAAGVRCVQLDHDNRCKLWGLASRPDFCDRFVASVEICGQSRYEAMQLITQMERSTGK